MKIVDGYYWIRLKSSRLKRSVRIFQPAEYEDGIWYLFGNENEFYDSDVAEIGERIIKK